VEISWARSATRHRIGRKRSRHVIEHAGLRFEQTDPRLVYLGDDADGVALEVMAIELEDGSLLVIHAMKLRDRYREQYEEATRWRR
jgi:hypothetical protein